MAKQTNKSRHAALKQAAPPMKAAAGGAMPPGPPPAKASTPGRRPTLTQIFNHASDPRVQIGLLQQKLSRPAPTLEFGLKGSVTKGINPKRDRKILKTIKALSQVIAQNQQRQTQQNKIQMGRRNQIRNTFNRKAGRGM